MKYPVTANRLNEALNEANMTPQELSRKSGVNKASISQYRNGTHKPGNVSSGKMAEVLGVSPVWLMGFDVEKDGSSEYLFHTKKGPGLHINDIALRIEALSPERRGTMLDYLEFLLVQQLKEDKKS